jgi:hypothetical protein
MASESAKVLQRATRAWTTVKKLADKAAECLPEEEGRELKNEVKRKARESLLVVERRGRQVTPAPAPRREGAFLEDEPTEPVDAIEVTANGFEAIQELDRTLRDIEETTQPIPINHLRRRTAGSGEDR